MTVGELTDALGRLPRDRDVTIEVVKSDGDVDVTYSVYARGVVAETHVGPRVDEDGVVPVVIRGW